MDFENHPLLDAVKSGDDGARNVFLEELVSEVKRSFRNLYFPWHCGAMFKSESAAWGEKVAKLDFEIERGKVCSDPAVELAFFFSEILGKLLTGFEKPFLKLFEIRTGFPSLEEFKALVKENQPTHLWVGSEFIGSLFQLSNKGWGNYYEPAHQELTIKEGRLGYFYRLGVHVLTVYSDTFRYATMQSLEPNQWLLVPEKYSTKFWVQWSPLKHEKEVSTFSATLLMGRKTK